MSIAGALGAAALLATVPGALAAPVPDHVPGEVVVRFAPDRPAGAVASALAAVDARDADALAPLPATRVVEVGDDVTVAEAVDALEQRPDVLWAEPNYVWTIAATPDDPRFAAGDLWGLRNLGQLDAPGGQTGTPGIDLGAPSSWDVTTGSPDVLVGVADTGIAHHADLDANVRDDLSRDFAHPDREGNGDPRLDPNSHGTHVAGTIGAVGDNGRGVVGVGWRTGLVALRVLFGRSGTSADIAAGFAYAGQRGLPIVNASLGGPGDSQAVRDAIDLAPRTLFVVAAGNDTNDNDASPSYPCNIPAPNLVCVAAIDNRGALASFSNFGATSVDLAAPGVRTLSTVPTYAPAQVVDLTGFPSWSTYGTGASWALDGTELAVPYGPDIEAYAATPPIDLTGKQACNARVSWALDADGTPADIRAWMAVEQLDPNSGLWRAIGTRYGSTPTRVDDFALLAEDTDDVRLRFSLFTSAEAGGTHDGARVDALSVVCEAPGETYTAYSGTSMATPHVAGAAALLLARRPDLTTAQLRSALLSTTRALPSLTGKTVTGGMIDLPAALAAVAPPAPPTPGGGGGSTPTDTPPAPAPEPAPASTEPPVAPPAPVAPALVAAPPVVQATPGAARRAARRGVVAVTLRAETTTAARVAGVLRWRGGSAQLRATTRRLEAGERVRLRLRIAAGDRDAVRAARRRGRALRAVLQVRTGAETVRHVVTLR